MTKNKKRANRLKAWKDKQKSKYNTGVNKYLYDDAFSSHEFSGVKPKEKKEPKFFSKKYY